MPSAVPRRLCLEIDPAHSLARLVRRLAAAGGGAGQFGRIDQPRRGYREADDFDRRGGVAVAEAAAVLGMKGRDEGSPVLGREGGVPALITPTQLSPIKGKGF